MQRQPSFATIQPAARAVLAVVHAHSRVSLALAGCAGQQRQPQTPTATNGTIGPNTLNVADAAIAGGDPSMALSVSQSILATDPDNVDALVHEGDAYLRARTVARPPRRLISWR